jgi:hypothetical protein
VRRAWRLLIHRASPTTRQASGTDACKAYFGMRRMKEFISIMMRAELEVIEPPTIGGIS